MISSIQEICITNKVTMNIFSIEGNIGAGKTTFLKQLDEVLPKDKFVVLFEPVEEWTKIKLSETLNCESDVNLLGLFYEDQKRYSFMFQMHALQTRYLLLNKTIQENQDKTIICERSPWTDYEIFVKMLNNEGNFSALEMHLYKTWFDLMYDNLINIKSKFSGIMYLKVDPETCLDRINQRNRGGEHSIQKSYLDALHSQHENWIKTMSHMVITNNDLDKVLDFIKR